MNCPASAYKGTTEGQFAAKKPLITMKSAVFTADFYFLTYFFIELNIICFAAFVLRLFRQPEKTAEAVFLLFGFEEVPGGYHSEELALLSSV